MDLGKALSGGGALLVAGAVLLSALGFSLFGEVAEPYKEAGERTGIAQAPHDFCHPGWAANDVDSPDVVTLTCERNKISIVLESVRNAEGKVIAAPFQHAAFPDGTFTENESDPRLREAGW